MGELVGVASRSIEFSYDQREPIGKKLRQVEVRENDLVDCRRGHRDYP